ncbi:MAG TPA: hypothetical protein VHH92_07380 [Actinomycetota bacterium]|nr:hypothetical protein [Actinomycetota bacterium]
MGRPLPGRAAVALMVCLVIPAAAGCGAEPARGSKRAIGSERYHASSDLPGLVLRLRERPEGTELREDLSGRQGLERFLPTSCCLGLQAAFDEAGFQIAHVRVFERPGHSADPIDTRPGWEVAESTAALFLDEEGAAQAMDVWVGEVRTPFLETVDLRLGEEAVGLTGSPESAAERMFFFVWRRGRLLLSLRASTGVGTVSVDRVRVLAERMDARAR